MKYVLLAVAVAWLVYEIVTFVLKVKKNIKAKKDKEENEEEK